MTKKQNNYAFIDSQNLNLSIRECGWRLDFKKFYVFLEHKYRAKKIFLFIGYIRENKKLYKYLENIGYILIFKPVIGKSNFTKGNVDAELVLFAAAIQYPKYDKGVIVSGDGDFYCLIEYLKRQKKLLRIIIPNRKSESSLLKDFQEYKSFLDREKNKLQLDK